MSLEATADSTPDHSIRPGFGGAFRAFFECRMEGGASHRLLGIDMPPLAGTRR